MTRVALVTGAAGGIGRATATACVQAGYEVVAADRDTEADAPAGCHFRRVDLASPGEISALIASIADDYERLDLIVNNAAVQICKPVEETTIDDWDLTMAVNLRAVFWLVREATPWLGQRGGAIVNIASVHALATAPNIAAYAASKAGLLGLTRALATELAADGIRVNAVVPGAVDTPMLEAGLSRGHLGSGDVKALKAELARRTPAGHLGRPQDIAETAVFLADNDRSGFVTGQAFVVDGGATARLSTE